jgi:hypothetical protein
MLGLFAIPSRTGPADASVSEGPSLHAAAKGDLGCPESLRLLTLAWVTRGGDPGSRDARVSEEDVLDPFGCVSVESDGFSVT